MLRRFILLLILITVVPAYAQEGGTQTVVVAPTTVVAFVVDRDLQTASATDTGPDGLSVLADIFRGYGAQVTFIGLNQEVPPQAKIVVLARPIGALPTPYLARLWRHIENGNHLLFTVDPVGYPSARAERANGGIGTLLSQDYGAGFQDTFLAEHWFSYDSIANPQGSSMAIYGDIVPNPVTAPLLWYDIPVQVWGARTVNIEPFGLASFAFPLVSARTGFVETNLQVFIGGVPVDLEFTAGEDFAGRAITGGLARNRRTGSRIALLGDSEIFQNGFGLGFTSVTSDTSVSLPIFPGNYILAQRVAAWLMDLPANAYPPLPEGFTWLRLDGTGDDWDAAVPAVTDSDASPVSAPAYDIQQVRAFHNADYLYMLVETASTPAQTGHITLQVQSPDGAAEVVTLNAYSNRVALVEANGTETRVPDGRMVIGSNALELRIPLRVTGIGSQLRVEQVCLNGIQQQDCLDTAFDVTFVPQRDPVPVRFPNTPLATINSPDRSMVNLRSGPGTDFETVGFFDTGVALAAVGRNEAGSWIYVENARSSGWVLSLLAITNTEILNLPVIAP